MAISDDPWHTPVADFWKVSCHYVFWRITSVPTGERSPISHMRGERSTTTPPRQIGYADHHVQFLIDTCCNCNILTRETYNQLNISKILENPEALLSWYTGHNTITDDMTIIPVIHIGIISWNILLSTGMQQTFWEQTHVLNTNYWDPKSLFSTYQLISTTFITHQKATYMYQVLSWSPNFRNQVTDVYE